MKIHLKVGIVGSLLLICVLLIIFVLQRSLIHPDDQLINPFHDNPEIWQDVSNDTFTHYINNPFASVISLADGGDAIWFGLTDGVLRYDNKKQSWQIFTMSDGIRFVEYIHQIAVTKKYVWAASWHGVNKYNKITRKWSSLEVPSKKEIGGRIGFWARSVECMQCDVQYLWIGGEAGLLRYSVNDREWLSIVSNTGRVAEPIHHILVTTDYVWAASRQSLYKVDRTTNKYVRVPLLDFPTDHFITTLIMIDHHILVGTTDGLFVYDSKKISNFDTEKWLSHSRIQTIAQCGDTTWIGSDKGITIHIPKRDTLIPFPITEHPFSGSVRSISVDKNTVWILGNKLWRFDRADNKITDCLQHYSFRTSGFSNLLVTEYAAWFTGKGIYKYSKAAGTLNWWGNYTHRHNSVKSIAHSKWYVWLGTPEGLRQYSYGSKIWRRLTVDDGLLSNEIDLLHYERGKLWIVSRAGICCFNAVTKRWQQFANTQRAEFTKVTAMCLRGQSEIWIGTEQGLIGYELHGDSLLPSAVPYFMEKRYITSIAWQNYALWIGTDIGLYEYDLRDSIWRYHTFDLDEGGWVWTIIDTLQIPDRKYLDKEWFPFTQTYIYGFSFSKNALWAVVSVGGFHANKRLVYKYDIKQHRWCRLVLQENIWGNIHEVKSDEDILWVATNHGLYKILMRNGLLHKYTGLNETDMPNSFILKMDTLIEDDIKCLTLKDNDVWCGTQRGISVLNKSTNKWTTHFWSIPCLPTTQSIIVGEKYIWIQGGQWCRYDKLNGVWSYYDHHKTWFNACSFIDRKGEIWFGTRRGIRRLLFEKNEWQVYELYAEVKALVRHKDNLWLATNSDLRMYNLTDETWRVFAFEPDSIVQPRVLCVYDDKVWIGNRKGCAYFRINDSNYVYLNNAVRRRSIDHIFAWANTLWLITYSGVPYAFQFENDCIIPCMDWTGPYLRILCGVAQGDDCIWVSQWKSAVRKYSLTENKWIDYHDPFDNQIAYFRRVMAFDPPYIWVAFRNSIAKINVEKLQMVEKSHELFRVKK